MKSKNQLLKKIKSMSREELELLAQNIVYSLYGEPSEEDDLVLNQDREWMCETVEDVNSDIDNAGLTPDQL